MKIYLIRHGLTKGNEEKRYVGQTDEPLSELGRLKLMSVAKKCEKIHPDIIFQSPMLRCVQTAEILFPDCAYTKVEELKECRFGQFEYKNYQELNGNTEYQKWIDSGGMDAFPGGEAPEDFRMRCRTAFLKEVAKIEDKFDTTVVFVVHGGTIMSILDAVSAPHKDYFAWQVSNGEGFMGQYCAAEKRLYNIEKL